MGVILDWLDLTYSPDDGIPARVAEVLHESLFTLAFSSVERGGTKDIWKAPDTRGALVLSSTPKWCRVSASGSVLEHFRSVSMLGDYLAALSLSPYRITRLDAALDFETDAADHLDRLRAEFPRYCRLTRKGVSTNVHIRVRDDGRETGTFYVGNHQSGSASARVYDKQLELLVNTGEIVGPRTRYEVTARKNLMTTLRDASDPTSLFWHLASPCLLPTPANIVPWVPADPDDVGWRTEVREFTAYQVLKNRVGNTADLSALAALSFKLGPDGPKHLLRMIEDRLESEVRLQQQAQVGEEPGDVQANS